MHCNPYIWCFLQNLGLVIISLFETTEYKLLEMNNINLLAKQNKEANMILMMMMTTCMSEEV